MVTSTSTSLHVLGAEGSGAGGTGMVADVHKLHILLTWPFFLHTSQREDMKCTVRDAAKAHSQKMCFQDVLS